jgi:hypothetical protein
LVKILKFFDADPDPQLWSKIFENKKNMFYALVLDQTKTLPLFLGLLRRLAVRFFAALVRGIPTSFPLLLPLLVGFLSLLVGFLPFLVSFLFLFVGFLRLLLVGFFLIYGGGFLDGGCFLGFPFLP